MPISVTCGSCSAAFTVKDEYAGKRAKCPKCGEPFTVPAAAVPPPPAAPVVARPVVAKPVAPPASPSRERAATRDDDDTPRAKRRNRDDDDEDKKPRSRRRDDDEDDQPKRKRGEDSDNDQPKRRRGDDGDDDKPRSRRRRQDDDDDEPKKKSAWPIILGILGALVLVCGGGCGAMWIFYINPAIEQVKANSSRLSTVSLPPPKVVPAETERPREEPPVADLKLPELMDSLRTDRKKYDKKWIKLTGPVTRVNTATQPGKPEWGQLYLGVLQTGLVVCHFDWGEWAIKPAPFSDELVYTVLGLFDANELGVSMSHCRVVGFAAANPSTVVQLPDLLAKPAAFQNKLVDVKGKIQKVTPDGGGWQVVIAPAAAGKGVWFVIPAGTKLPSTPEPGDEITVRATVTRDTPAQVELTLKSVIFLLSSKPPAPPPPSALSVAEVLKDADGGFRNRNVAVRGKVKLVLEHADGNQGTVVFEETDGKHALHAVFPPGKWRKDFVQGGDTIDVRGTLSGLLGNPGSGLHYDIQDCDLTRRLDQGGKEVPLPPIVPPAAAIKVNAKELAGEFAADLERAKKKYTDKTVTVTGVLEQLPVSGTKVILSGVPADGSAKAFVVEAFMSFENRNDVRKLMVGDTVTLTAKYGGFRPPVGNTVPNGVMLTGGQLQK
jgi:hypothetical protein